MSNVTTYRAIVAKLNKQQIENLRKKGFIFVPNEHEDNVIEGNLILFQHPERKKSIILDDAFKVEDFIDKVVYSCKIEEKTVKIITKKHIEWLQYKDTE